MMAVNKSSRQVSARVDKLSTAISRPNAMNKFQPLAFAFHRAYSHQENDVTEVVNIYRGRPREIVLPNLASETLYLPSGGREGSGDRAYVSFCTTTKLQVKQGLHH